MKAPPLLLTTNSCGLLGVAVAVGTIELTTRDALSLPLGYCQSISTCTQISHNRFLLPSCPIQGADCETAESFLVSLSKHLIAKKSLLSGPQIPPSGRACVSGMCSICQSLQHFASGADGKMCILFSISLMVLSLACEFAAAAATVSAVTESDQEEAALGREGSAQLCSTLSTLGIWSCFSTKRSPIPGEPHFIASPGKRGL